MSGDVVVVIEEDEAVGAGVLSVSTFDTNSGQLVRVGKIPNPDKRSVRNGVGASRTTSGIRVFVSECPDPDDHDAMAGCEDALLFSYDQEKPGGEWSRTQVPVLAGAEENVAYRGGPVEEVSGPDGELLVVTTILQPVGREGDQPSGIEEFGWVVLQSGADHRQIASWSSPVL